MKEKFKILFIPFLTVAVVFTIICNLIYWLLFHFFYPLHYIEPGIILLSVFILAWISVLIWMRPRINLLVLDKSRGQYFAFQIVCVFLTTLVAHLTTQFTEMAAGKLTKLQNINKIDKHTVTKFYTIEHLDILKKYKQTYYASSITGRRSKSLRLNVYVVCPVFNENVEFDESGNVPNKQLSSGKNKRYSSIDTTVALIRDKYSSDIVYLDTSQQQIPIAPPLARASLPKMPKVWLCLNYEKSLKEIVYGDRRKQVESDFYIDCLQQFDKKDFELLTYLENVDNNITRGYYQKAIGLNNGSVPATGVFLLEPKFNPYTMRWQCTLSSALTALTCCAAGWLLMILFVKFDSHKLQNFLTVVRK